ncbi:hypothetical protein PN498_05855 [Oscillatoria sp. CS-180]|uniref:hypothetical protein n=1 Tax=Oscillatoria sp. CS-180 TaxID=3021720 RepID=UPI00232DAC88|nr:hypothetical protein [Oscillatoria sp. CS-180]MDB9525504.1 hypothetical protein [Oscillatoria sp. CS-180]
MSLATNLSKTALSLGVMAVTSTGAAFFTPSAQAATFDLDFNWSGLIVDGDATNAGQALDANQLDTRSGQRIDGTKFSTKKGNIGSIWDDYGISITGLDKQGRRSNSAPLGLFNSNCVARGGVSVNGFTGTCARNGSLGDNDLATGKGSYGNVTYDTIAQGNLLIFEENKGNGTADDTSKGGTFVFDIANDKNWFVEEIGIVDDARGEITYTYRDGTVSTEMIDINGENELQFFNAAQEKEIAQVAVRFDGSGGISALRFRDEVVENASVPEPTMAIGLISLGAIVVRTKRQRKTTLA